MRSRRSIVLMALPVILMVALTGPAAFGGMLARDELLLVYNDAEPAAKGLAQHYAEVRGVPANRLCPVIVLGKSEEITPGQFERLIRQQVRGYLDQHGLRGKVRCLVTFYGLPIRVSPRKNTTTERVLLLQWRHQLQETLIELDRTIAELGVLAGENAATRPTETQPAEDDLPRLAQDYERVRTAAFRRIMRVPLSDQPPPEFRQFVKLIEAGEGTAKLLAQMNTQRHAGEEASPMLVQSQREMQEALSQVRTLMAREYTDPEREKARPLLRQWEGLLGVAYSLQDDMNEIQGRETGAAVDNELMLLWRDRYPRYRWMPNPLNWRNRAAQSTRSAASASTPATQPVETAEPETLMVCRIDGPTAGVARRIIDESIAIEKTGLRGAVAIDSRGARGNQGFAEYDADLRDLAQLLKNKTPLVVRLDVRDALFAPGDCPETMLYCGWKGEYVRACTFVSGSVGFHITSSGAISLNRPSWSRSLLLDGMVATLGPVAEPYLFAFPKPTEFFGLLTTGRMTLAECYACTTPCTSWMMMMIGDPLYRPFAANPALSIEQVFPLEVIPPEYAGNPLTSPAGG